MLLVEVADARNLPINIFNFLTTFMAEYYQKPSSVGLLKMTLEVLGDGGT